MRGEWGARQTAEIWRQSHGGSLRRRCSGRLMTVGSVAAATVKLPEPCPLPSPFPSGDDDRWLPLGVTAVIKTSSQRHQCRQRFSVVIITSSGGMTPAPGSVGFVKIRRRRLFGHHMVCQCRAGRPGRGRRCCRHDTAAADPAAAGPRYWPIPGGPYVPLVNFFNLSSARRASRLEWFVCPRAPSEPTRDA